MLGTQKSRSAELGVVRGLNPNLCFRVRFLDPLNSSSAACFGIAGLHSEFPRQVARPFLFLLIDFEGQLAQKVADGTFGAPGGFAIWR